MSFAPIFFFSQIKMDLEDFEQPMTDIEVDNWIEEQNEKEIERLEKLTPEERMKEQLDRIEFLRKAEKQKWHCS